MTDKPIMLNDQQKIGVQAKYATYMRAKKDFETYIMGLKDGMGLNGDHTFDMNLWAFMPAKEKKDATEETPKPKEEIVG